MKKWFLVVMAGIFLKQSLSAQDDSRVVANKVFYSELGGPGVLMSANFDSRFKPYQRLGFGFRLGAGFAFGSIERRSEFGYYESNHTRTYYTIPAGLNYVFGNPNSHQTFEVGAGVTLLTRKVSLYYHNDGERKPGNVIGFFTFMYRSMPVDGGFSFRIGLTPIIGTSGELQPSGAIGFGYVF